MTAAYADSVFINCPFDDSYRPFFRAIIFAVHDAGFVLATIASAPQSWAGPL